MASTGRVEIKIDADVDPALREIRRLEAATRRATRAGVPALQFRYGFALGLASGVFAVALSQILDGLL